MKKGRPNARSVEEPASGNGNSRASSGSTLREKLGDESDEQEFPERVCVDAGEGLADPGEEPKAQDGRQHNGAKRGQVPRSTDKGIVDVLYRGLALDRDPTHRRERAKENLAKDLGPDSTEVMALDAQRRELAGPSGEVVPEDHRDPATEWLLAQPGMREALASHPQGQNLFADMGNPRLGKISLTALARKWKLGPVELVEIFRTLTLAKGAFGYLQHVPRMAEKMGEMASHAPQVCPDCSGQGWREVKVKGMKGEDGGPVMEERDCPRCAGSGSVNLPDKDARGDLLETIGWTRRSKGPMVQVNVGGSLESALDEIDSLIPSGELP